MKKQLIAGLILTAAAYAQMVGGGGGGGGGGRGTVVGQFQQAGTMGTVAARGGNLSDVVFLNSSAQTSIATIPARPFSAREERKSVQTLGDGTEISNSDTAMVYRDSQGRTRVETQPIADRTMVTITDPVSRYTVTLNSANMVARKIAMPDSVNSNSQFRVVQDQGVERVGGMVTVAGTAAGGGGRGGRGGRGAVNKAVEEDLGAQTINGVVATGHRSTMTIPMGTIGNNRDIQVKNERWYSEELQMLVKTVNSDPRFGEDTYELTNISRNEPAPTLFQIPAGYSVMEGGRGRGGAQAGQQITVPVVIK